MPDSLVFIPVLELVEIDKHLTGYAEKGGTDPPVATIFPSSWCSVTASKCVFSPGCLNMELSKMATILEWFVKMSKICSLFLCTGMV